MKFEKILLSLALTLALVAPVVAQAPATVTEVELNADSLPNLGAQISWSSVPNATYAVYRYSNNGYQTCTSSHFGWAEIVSGLSALTYSDYPTGDQYGWGGDWCYGVSATVNGTESAITPVPKPAILGIGYYFDWAYYTQDCSTFVGYPTGEASFVLTRVRNGNSMSMPAQLVTTNNPHRWAGHFRALNTDYLYATFTLPPDAINPQGKVFTFPNLFGGQSVDGFPITADWGPYVNFQVRADDGICQIDHYEFLQPAINN